MSVSTIGEREPERMPRVDFCAAHLLFGQLDELVEDPRLLGGEATMTAPLIAAVAIVMPAIAVVVPVVLPPFEHRKLITECP